MSTPIRIGLDRREYRREADVDPWCERHRRAWPNRVTWGGGAGADCHGSAARCWRPLRARV